MSQMFTREETSKISRLSTRPSRTSTGFSSLIASTRVTWKNWSMDLVNGVTCGRIYTKQLSRISRTRTPLRAHRNRNPSCDIVPQHDEIKLQHHLPLYTRLHSFSSTFRVTRPRNPLPPQNYCQSCTKPIRNRTAPSLKHYFLFLCSWLRVKKFVRALKTNLTCFLGPRRKQNTHRGLSSLHTWITWARRADWQCFWNVSVILLKWTGR